MKEELPDDPDELVEWVARRHGRSRAESVRWRGFLEVCRRLFVESRRRKEAALMRALDELERAAAYEESEARWIRVAHWVARRVDEMENRVARSTKLYTRIDFTTQEVTEEIRPTDLDTEGDIEW